MISTSEFWERATRAASDSPTFRATAEHLKALTIGFGIGDASLFLDFHRGRVTLLPSKPLDGTDVTIAGPAEEWQRLVTGKIPYARAINIAQGKLRLEGNLVAAAWAVQALCELFRVAARIAAKEEQHA